MAFALLAIGSYVSAESYSSTSYRINGEIGASSGGESTSSATYKLVSTSGESIVGQGSGGSYKLDAGYIAQLNRSLSLSLQPSGSVAYLPLDSNVTDQSPIFNAANSAITTLHSTGGATSVAGKVGSALQFNGTNQYVDDSPSDDANYNNVSSTAGTIELWFKSPSATASDQFLISREGGCKGWQLKITTSGQIHAQFATSPTDCGSATYTSVDSPSSYVDNTWHHAAMTIDRATSTLRLYIDGQSVASANTIPASDPGVGGTLKIAADYANLNLLAGTLDEVKIFSRALKTDEISAEYAAGAAGVPSGLSLGAVTPGVSNTASADVVVQADTGSYSLSINQNNDLKTGSYTIPAVSANISSPAAWTEGATKGLGFTLTSGPSLDGKWGSGANYAALPGTSTTFYNRINGGAIVKDTVAVSLRTDVASTQPTGNYSNIVTVTGTITP